MEIGIVGGGASGLFAALFLSKNRPDWKISVFDKEERIGRKLFATGNGHCNILAKELDGEKYSDPAFASSLFKNFPFGKLKEALEENGLFLSERKEGIYPISYSASVFTNTLIETLRKRRVAIKPATRIEDYEASSNGVRLCFPDGSSRSFDRVVIAVGGRSSPRLGSDGSFARVMEKHGYVLCGPVPGLAPIAVSEGGLGQLKGIRHEALLSLNSPACSFLESGEVLFKNDGLSGIVVFNLSSFLSWHDLWGKAFLSLDLFPNFNLGWLEAAVQKAETETGQGISSFLERPLADYIGNVAKRSGKSEAFVAKHLIFHPKKPYGWDDSQVTHGGISLDDIDKNFNSKKEPWVSIIGEALNLDGPCGGYNLSFCLASALALSKAVRQ